MDYQSEINSLETLKKHKRSNHYGDISGLKDTGAAVMFGTGLASMRGISLGFGVEFLSMFLTVVYLQKTLGFSDIVHEFGTVGYNIERESAEAVLDTEMTIVKNLRRNLDISNYTIIQSEEYHSTPEFIEIYHTVKECLKTFSGNPMWENISRYTEIQIAGMKYLYETYHVRMKCGWTNSGNRSKTAISDSDVSDLISSMRLNEFLFDTVYRYVFPSDNFSFVYVDCGRDISNGNGVIPYTVDHFQVRPILNGTSIKAFSDSVGPSKAKTSIISNWGKTVTLYEKLFSQIDIGPVESEEEKILKKLDYIQGKVLFSKQ